MDRVKRWGALGICMLALAIAVPAPAMALEPLAQIGGSGAGAGQLDLPAEIAIGAEHDLFITEELNDRVTQYHPDGSFVKAWGFDVIPGNGKVGFEACTTATGCKAAASGGGAGQFDEPRGIDVDEAGDIYIAESHNNRVSHFTATGTFVNAWGLDVSEDFGGGTGFEVCTVKFGCKDGDSGGGPGALSSPSGLALVPGGDLYVADVNNNRVSRFTTAGKFVSAWGFDVIPGNGEEGFEVCTTATGCKPGTQGGGAGQMTLPKAIAAGRDGHLFVSNNGRISEFAPSGDFVRTWGFDVIPGNAEEGFEVCTTATGCKGLKSGGGAAGQMGGGSVFGLAATPTGDVYAPDGLLNRVTRFTDGAINSSFGFDVIAGNGEEGFEVCAGAAALCKAGLEGPGFGELTEPVGAEVDCRGAVWVVDNVNDRVTRFGEPDTPLPPACTDPPVEEKTTPLPPSGGTVTVKPSNGFTVGKVILNRKKGTAKLPVDLPGPGVLELSGKDIKPSGKISVSGAGRFQFPVDPSRKKRKTLKKTGKVSVAVTVTYTPTGGDPNSLRATVQLKLKEASKATPGKGR
jgi:hypothetical protein